MKRRLIVALARLTRWLVRPSVRIPNRLLQVASFYALDPPNPPSQAPARCQTLLGVADQFLLLVDEFHAPREQVMTLRVEAAKPLGGGRRRYITRDQAGALAIYPLGDYAVKEGRRALEFRQRLQHGRFLLALTRDPEASVRVLNGWAVEIRTGGRVYHLLHSNRARRLRPLGPVQTDARFALVDMPPGEGLGSSVHGTVVRVIQASQLMWENQRIVNEVPFDLALYCVEADKVNASHSSA